MDEAEAFVVPKVSRRTSSTQLSQAPRFDKEGRHIAMNVVSTGGGVDLERAQYCADHFGACSVEEVEAMKHGKSSMCLGPICYHLHGCRVILTLRFTRL
jgi:hypothetical protein